MEGHKFCFLGRGGSGKSTCLVLMANVLRERGHEVCVLDADSTNIGLHKALGIAEAPAPLVRHFGGMVFQGGLITCPVDDPSLVENARIDLEDLPDQFQRSNANGITLLETGKLVEFGLGAGCDGPMVKLARDIRVCRGEHPVTLLVDFKAGLEDASRGALVGMDALVLVCDPSLAGIETAASLKRILDAKRVGSEPSTAHLDSPGLAALMRRLYREWRVGDLHIVLNKVPDPETEAYLRQQLAAKGIQVDACVPDTRELRQAWLHGRALGTAPRPEELAALVDTLVAEVTILL